ncbi:hypothetical protein M436DRAFT_42304 [Aureobasidium namibiae CBS 147.97]|uniref:BTB domain-containing protein n=1 Tax=Aureobasidium namibiae CBS 147.97 TaxID=1043004 RepID=A0A074WNK1_9PEZI|nr:uncharacterized protein M436DRAFT_42304 [Aureobasidium namibiae CBS 147.97]KEQ74718.1 hypothetical protein M436DRAFT_42304 [Aureobasidium namibiae CBS 147.97]
MDRKHDWQRNVWSKQIVDRIKVTSRATINLRSTYGVLQSINKELLCYFSPYYHAALHGRFAEAHQKIFQVDLTGKQLHVFVNWVHTGRLELHSWDREDRVKLYIFADYVDILALRRQILTEPDRMEKYREVGVVMSSLPSTSPFRMRIADHYAMHWEPEDDKHDPVDALDVTLHREFLDDIEKSVVRAKAMKLAGCPCCGNPCRYHEHASEEEWRATCGQLPTSRQPEEQYYINSGNRAMKARPDIIP